METAARLFAEHGYEGTSMDQVAAAAGAGKQSLYRRYANKADLFNVVFSKYVIAQDRNLLRRSLDPYSPKHLVALIVSWPLIQCLVNTSSLHTPAKRQAYFNSAWEAFLHSKANVI
jgi:AcrR family transcriptional regulator